MENKVFARNLESRTKKFAISVLKMLNHLPSTPEGRTIRYQLSKSCSSIGANYREANRARSKADFKNKIKICESEASETVYWLSIIYNLNWGKKAPIETGMKEANELLAIFTSIGNKL